MVVCLVVGLGCYRPSIEDGGLRCGAAPKPCPDGFECDRGAMICRRTGSLGDASTARDGGGGEAAGGDGRDAADVACFAPVPGCTPETGRCDPTCQTGCACREKCSVSSAGARTCTSPLVGTLKQAQEPCAIFAPGTTVQADDCAPGLVCIEDSCNGRCYRFCHGDADCPDSMCTRDAGGGIKVCDVPTIACDPVGRAATESCPSKAQGCYLAAAGTDRTLCDCPFSAVAEGEPCVLSRDCLPGLACVGAADGGTDGGAARCEPVCALAGGGCPNGRACMALNGSTVYGTCSP